MRTFYSYLRRLDWLMLASMLMLVGLGVRLIQSAGGARTSVLLQGLWSVHAWTAVAGLVLYFALAAIDYRKMLRWCAGPFFALALLFLVAVLMFGAVRYGGRRW